MICRTGEAEKHWFRSHRLFVVDSNWFFTTRENFDIDPFGAEDNALQGLKLFIKNVQQEGQNETTAANIAINGQWAQTLYQ